MDSNPQMILILNKNRILENLNFQNQCNFVLFQFLLSSNENLQYFFLIIILFKATMTKKLYTLYIHRMLYIVPYIDFMKAFDKVSNLNLIHQLRVYGFGCRLIDWISAFGMKESNVQLKAKAASDGVMQTAESNNQFQDLYCLYQT